MQTHEPGVSVRTPRTMVLTASLLVLVGDGTSPDGGHNRIRHSHTVSSGGEASGVGARALPCPPPSGARRYVGGVWGLPPTARVHKTAVCVRAAHRIGLRPSCPALALRLRDAPSAFGGRSRNLRSPRNVGSRCAGRHVHPVPFYYYPGTLEQMGISAQTEGRSRQGGVIL